MAFIDQVQDLTSLSVSDTDELSQFLKDGVIDVTNRCLAVKPQDINAFIRESSETTSNASLDLNGAQIISVVRENGTNNQWKACRQIFPVEQYDVTNTESLSYASKYNPAFMIGDNGQISVFPTPDATTDAFKAYYVNNAPVDKSGAALIHSHSDIGYFADDKVYLVVMYAGMKLLQANMGATTITDLSVTAVPPDVPTITASTISFGASVPTYSTPTQTISGTNWATAYPDEYSAINTALAAIATEVGLAKTEVAEIVTQTDGSSDFATALTAMNDELDKADDIIVEASAEFDEAKNLSEAYSSGKVKDALYAMSTELNKADGIIANADTAIGRYYTDIADIDDTTELWDNTNKRFTVVRDALTYAGNLIDGNKPHVDYDAAANLSDVDAAFAAMDAHLADGEAILTNDPTSGAILTALDAIKSNVDLANGVIDSAPVPPDTPTLSSTSIAAFSSAPTYTAPKVAGATEELTATITSGTIGTDADFQDFSDWFEVLGHMIEDEEDTELAQAQLGKISSYIQAYSTAMQNQLNIFNDANIEFQADIQRKFKEADFDNQEDARLLQKFSAEVQEYQAEVGEMSARSQGYLQTAQGYAGECQARISYATAYQQASAARGAEGNARANQLKATVSVAAQELQRANVAIAEINTIMASYRLDIEGVAPYLQTAQGYIGQAAGYAQEVQAYANAGEMYIKNGNAYIAEAQAYIAQAGGYAQEITARGGFTSAKSQAVQGYIQTSQGYAKEVQALLSQVPVKVSEYQARVQDKLNEFNKLNIEYQAQLQVSIENAKLEDAEEAKKLQKFSAEIQEYQAEVGAQVQEYTQNLQADGVGYQWLQDQYARLKAEYDQAFMLAAPKQQPQQQVRA